jgi:nicotinamide-nucleotide adenylyltransferase
MHFTMKPNLQITIPTTFTAAVTSLLSRITHGTASQGVGLVYTPHDHWPLPRSPSYAKTKDTIRISVLDSSFNPPTLAHLALAKASFPLSTSNEDVTSGRRDAYDASLLLLSVRNADKALKQGDATYLQRLEMMYLLARDIEHPHLEVEENMDDSEVDSNVAIAIIDEPTFIGKSTALLTFLRSRLSSFSSAELAPNRPTPRLTFLLGVDTLERLFSPRYYPSQSEESMLRSLRYFFGQDEGSTIVCARRDPASYPSASSPSSSQSPPPATGTPEDLGIPQTAKEFFLADQIKLIDIGVKERAFSSSQVRQLVQSASSPSASSPSSCDGWKKMVSPRIARYVEERGMYLQ